MNENISLLNKADIKNGKLVNLIPEFYELKEVIENNDWHNNETVFDHTLSALNNLENIVRNSRKEIKQALNEIIEDNSRMNLLKIAVLLHDIAKKETIVSSNGLTFCPNHEIKGAEKARGILKRFNLSKKESKIITDIIKYHYSIHEIIILEDKQLFQKEYEKFKQKFSNIYLELILLAFADNINSHLKKTKPAEFRQEINFYAKELKSYHHK